MSATMIIPSRDFTHDEDEIGLYWPLEEREFDGLPFTFDTSRIRECPVGSVSHYWRILHGDNVALDRAWAYFRPPDWEHGVIWAEAHWFGPLGGIIPVYGDTPADTKLYLFGCVECKWVKRNIGICYNEKICEICKYGWRIDSSG
tara:strand:+ start:1133 stop:1567 length:435 start_codon:yes stop_codon:yes gene_type:complete